MKKALLILLSTLTTIVHAAVERVPIEDAQKGTLLLNNALGELKDAPFKLEVNAFRPCAVKGDGKAAALVVPAYSLNERIKDARRKTAIPAGQLWLHKMVPVVNGQAASPDSLRRIKIKTDEGESEVNMFHLAFERFGDGGKLLVIGKGKEPLVEVLLKPMKVPQEVPLELEVKPDAAGKPELVFYVADQFEGRLPLAPSE